ncbi:MAG: DUF3857 domain-containing protein [Burkholderiaceae bacterium]|nr:DUF3857 domain-containing protein [Burkholderiaceae bacterium]
MLASATAHAEPAYSVLKSNVLVQLQADGRWTETQDVQMRIDELSQEAQKNVIRFNSRLQTARLLSAYIERPDGKQRRLILHPQISASAGRSYLDERLLTTRFPALRVGDKLRYKLQITQWRSDAAASYFGLWAPGWPEPAQYTVTIDQPRTMQLHTQAKGFRSETLAAAPERTVTRWEWQGGHTRLEEGAIDSNNFLDTLTASSYGSYAELARNYDLAQQRLARGSSRLTELARSIAADAPDPRGKALAVDAWVRRHIRYRRIYPGMGTLSPTRTADRILQSGYGDCKDHGVLMEAMLSAVGMDSTPALLSSGNEFFTAPGIAMFYFNHVITYIPSLDLYLDASTKDIEGGYLALPDLDKPVLLTRSGEQNRTPAHQTWQVVKQFDVQVNADGSARFTDRVHISGHLAEVRRAMVRNASKSEAAGWLSTIFAGHHWTGAVNASYDNVQARSGDFRFTYANGVIRRFLPAASKTIIVTAYSALAENIGTAVFNAAVDASRTQPFRCEQQDIKEIANYTFPNTLAVASIPEDVRLHDDFFDYSAYYARTRNGVRIERHFLSGQSGSLLCTPERYAAAAATVQAMRKDMDGQIVLHRKAAQR